MSNEDKINPSHYKKNGLEVIDVIEAFFPDSPHKANAFKYMVREGSKPGEPWKDDIDKAVWYLDRYRSFKSKEEA